jgi:hypothetical protein
VNLVGHRFLAVGWNLHQELDRAAVELFEGIRILDDVPTRPAVKMLDDAHFDRVGFVIAHLHFEGFVAPAGTEIAAVFRAIALSGEVEGVAGVEADGFVLRGVVNAATPVAKSPN